MKTDRDKKVAVVKLDPDSPEPVEVIAKAIIELSDGVRRLNEGPLKQDTIVLLLHDVTDLPRRDIRKVLDAIPLLRNTFCKPDA